MDNELYHYGTPRHSGRYPWGSGENPYQNSFGWRAHIQELRDEGLTDKEIMEYEGIKSTEFRARNSISKDEIRAANVAEAIRLKEHGNSATEIGRRMGVNESVVRSWLDPIAAERVAITKNTANMLKDNVDRKKYIDVGAGVENYIGVSANRLSTAVTELVGQGYKLHSVKVPQLGMPGKFTYLKVLGAPDTDWKELMADWSLIENVDMVSNDYGRTFNKNQGLGPVKSVSSDRIQIRYADEGGGDKDGVIELRRGVEDLDLGGSRYAQVRIGVDKTHFLKGMAVYSDDMPDGVDIIFNTNKSDTGNKLDALKSMKIDPETGKIDKTNPFGATIKTNGQRGALNVVNEQGDWETWSKTLSSQMLSKQTIPLVQRQLDLSLTEKKDEYAEIASLTNPVVKKQLLQSFADDCDSSAVHLKAAGLPRQASQVILPVPSLKDNEVYAPNFRNGEVLVLIRHPHGGTFEIPQLRVNNNSKEGRAIIGTETSDAIGINPKVAQKLSGADFDGDTVIAIPNNTGAVKVSASLKALKNFDPVESYAPYDGMKTIDGGVWDASTRKVIYSGLPKSQTRQTKMGEVSNLITDMTIKGANQDEIARAVKHSMVVIDAEKHHLNYIQSYKDNGIASLAEKYQRSARGGASTIVSRAKSEYRVPERKERPHDPVTGERVYEYTGRTYIDKKGKVIEKTIKSTQMFEAKDARKLSSGRQVEEVYASYANSLKSLANKARREISATDNIPYSPSAKAVYANEVATLNSKLNIALKNAPLERQAQVIANSEVKRKKAANPALDKDGEKKLRNQALAKARVRTGASKSMIEITPKEWDAIQAGAISSSKLAQILNNTKLEVVKSYATPRSTTSMTSSKVSRAKAMIASGYTLAEVAESLGVSTTTISNAIK